MLLEPNRFQFRYQNAGQNQAGAENRSSWKPFAHKGECKNPGHHRFQRKNESGASGRSHLLGPGLHCKRESRREQRRDQQGQPQNRAGVKERLLDEYLAGDVKGGS